MTRTATAAKTTTYGIQDAKTGITVWAPAATHTLVWAQSILDLSLVAAGDRMETRYFTNAAMEVSQAMSGAEALERFSVITR